ncbi:MAG: ATP-binding cassette domain-containing protein, partial [Anaerolineae bacterium]
MLIEGVCVRYGEQGVLADVSFPILARSATAIIGPSGCGKTSLLRTLNRLNDAIAGARCSGKVWLFGEDVYRQGADVVELRRRVGMVFQQPNPFPMSVRDNILFGPTRLGERRRPRLQDILEDSLRRVGLWEEVKLSLDRSALELSGGQQQRLCIARALAVRPQVLLLDEPASSLDPAAATHIEQLVRQLAGDYAVVFVTHNLQQASRVADYTAVLMPDENRCGRLIEYGRTYQVFGSPSDKRTEAFITQDMRREQEMIRADKLEAVGLLAGGVAHDFNNLLTAIVGNIALARLDVEQQSDLGGLLSEAEQASMRARDLTQQLLTFAKGGAPVRRAASLSELVEGTCRFCLRGRSVRYRFLTDPALWTVSIDEGQMSQVVNNLIINAAEAMPQGGTITVTAENKVVVSNDGLPLPPGPYALLTIADEGVGIPTENLSRIFDPYFTTKETGSGLGLATVYSVVKRHDGHVSVDSHIGVGTTFRIYLPATEQLVVPPAATQTAPPPAGRGKILIVDDEEGVRQTARRMVERLGYETEVAWDGCEALAAYRQALESGYPFDVVVMDLTVPGGMGGKEAVQRL